MTNEDIMTSLCGSGLWPYLKQRPYDIIADPKKKPEAIYVTGFDSSPLAPDYDFILKGQASDFQTGLNALSKLTEGTVYIGAHLGCKSTEIKNAANVQVRFFEGPHPAGNVGVQINHIEPVNKGEVVWTTNALDVLLIGRFFNKGIVDLTRLVALTGPEVRKPVYVRCKPGIPIKALLDGNVYNEIPLRYINGNALTGSTVDPEGYLSAYSNQMTVLHEGSDTNEFLGWIMPRTDKFSSSRTYFTWLYKLIFPNMTYEPDTRILGGERALIMSDEYDRVFPMDILPEQLVRACITGDLERMENLGIYEVAPEDFALCEFVCTSKIEVQKVVREALDMLKKENGD
jgi:Na+-transporting NADH:ubiquinone oxidoreductase subunit A